MILDDIEIRHASFTPAEAIAGAHGLPWKSEADRHRLEKLLEAALDALQRGVDRNCVVVLCRAARDEGEAELVGDALVVEALEVDFVAAWLTEHGYGGVSEMLALGVAAARESELAIGMVSPELGLMAFGVIDWRQQVERLLAH